LRIDPFRAEQQHGDGQTSDQDLHHGGPPPATEDIPAELQIGKKRPANPD
jgi:hypothetical protein